MFFANMALGLLILRETLALRCLQCTGLEQCAQLDNMTEVVCKQEDQSCYSIVDKKSNFTSKGCKTARVTGQRCLDGMERFNLKICPFCFGEFCNVCATDLCNSYKTPNFNVQLTPLYLTALIIKLFY